MDHKRYELIVGNKHFTKIFFSRLKYETLLHLQLIGTVGYFVSNSCIKEVLTFIKAVTFVFELVST